MISKEKKHSILDMVEKSLHDVAKVKDISKDIRDFNKIKYPVPKYYKATDIRKIRKKLNVSQAILAYLLNAKLSTVQKWERGVKRPCGANNRLLQIIEKNGFKMLPCIESDGAKTMAGTLCFAILLIPASLTPVLLGMSGGIYFGGILLSGLALLAVAKIFVNSRSVADAGNLLKATVFYMPVWLILIILDNILI